MTRDALIKRTNEIIAKLPNARLNEVADFADFLLQKYEEENLYKGMLQLAIESDSFSFLNEEEVEYKIEDLKEKYQ